mgnify:CR=1 FL=1
MSSLIQEKPKLPMCRIDLYETQESVCRHLWHPMSKKFSYRALQKRNAELLKRRGGE